MPRVLSIIDLTAVYRAAVGLLNLIDINQSAVNQDTVGLLGLAAMVLLS